MCWNESISLNTFIFTSFVLLFILYNNTYTNYKLEEFHQNYLLYFFYLAFTIMQLFEYFLWKSVKQKNETMNVLFSILGFILIMFVQPLMSMAFISKTEINTRNNLLILYFSALIALFISKLNDKSFSFTTTVDNGHLKWNWLQFNGYEILFVFVWMFCAFYSTTLFFRIAGVIMVPFFFMYYYKEKTWGSMWCWALNAGLFIHLFRILIILPYYEYKNIC